MPRAFLSSAFVERHPGEELSYFAVRRSIYDLGQEIGVPVWVAECGENPLKPNEKDWVAPVKGCTDELRNSDLLIVVLASRSGNPYDLGEGLGKTAASVFEVELFHASNNRIPVFFFVVDGYEPDPELINLINVLRLNRGKNWQWVSEAELLARVRELLRALKASPQDVQSPLPLVPDHLAKWRGARLPKNEIDDWKLSLVGRFSPIGREDFSIDRFNELIDKSTRIDLADRYDQLSFLWMALRELSIGNADDPERLPFWEKVATEWGSVSSWLDLHGYLNTGVISAFHTRAHLRRLGRTLPAAYGGFASEFYSMAKLMQTARMKRTYFERSTYLATQQILASPKDPTGGLLIRASAKMQLAPLQSPWMAFGALSDYRTALKLRERLGHSDSALGETLVDYGYALFQVANKVHWKSQGALKMVGDGVRLLESDDAFARIGFVVRGKRKFAECLRAAGRLDLAEQQLRAATTLSEGARLDDQTRQIRSPTGGNSAKS